MKRALVWFRSDLRTEDNPALWHACAEAAEVEAVFLVARDQWRRHGWGPAKVDFILGCARELQVSLARLGIDLHILEADTFAENPRLLRQMALAGGFEAVFCNQELEVNELRRDEAVAESLIEIGVPLRSFQDQTVAPLDLLLSQSGAPYTVFTPFKKAWLALVEQTGIHLLPAPSRRRPLNSETPALTPFSGVLFQPGERAARKRLNDFLGLDVLDYDLMRDRVDVDGTSSLSPYLAAGCISIRTCLAHAFRTRSHHTERREGVDKWISELIWREFYRYVLFHFPQVCKGRPFRPETEQIVWDNDDDLFRAWKDGQTGFPIVDAGMRQLLAEGWLPNRIRMIVAMFLVKDLLIDWRLGEAHFMAHLLDADFASNNGGWQWCASTGNDAAPYFRIMNPILQSRKCDPHGDYIRRWVPELAHLDADAIHEPGALERVACRYPEPIVDHGEARSRALKAYASLT